MKEPEKQDDQAGEHARQSDVDFAMVRDFLAYD